MTPEPQPGPPRDPPPHSAAIYKIASAALWCLVSAFVVSFFLGGPAREAARQGMRGFYLAVNAANALLMLLSIVLGAVALCAIPKYGRKKLLWKGLVGVLVPILLTLLAIPAFLKIKRINEERARQSQQPP